MPVTLPVSSPTLPSISLLVVNQYCKTLWENEDGQDLVEYSLLLAFIALAAVGLLSGVRTSFRGLWSAINTTLASASTTAS